MEEKSNSNSFLDGLKSALDKGEFNSDAATYLNKIHEASEKVNAEDVEAKLGKNLEENPQKPVSEEEAKEMNKVYEDKISRMKMLDGINKAIVSLINLEADVDDAKCRLEQEVVDLTNEFVQDEPEYEELNERLKKIKKNFKFK